MPTVSRTIAITGANSGIGLRAAQRLAAMGHRVYALCRSPERGRAALDLINADAPVPARLVVVDLSSRASISAAVRHLHTELGRLDVLINNAAIFDQTMREPRFTEDGHELFWATNHLGPFQLTAELSQLLAAADHPCVIFAASKGLVTMPGIKIPFEHLADPSRYSPTKAYYRAKLAQIMTAFTLAERASAALAVTCVRIPAVRLDADRISSPLLRLLYAPKRRFAVPPERIADVYARTALGEQDWSAIRSGGADRERFHGIYVDENLTPVNSPRFAYDPAAREQLWRVSLAATGNPALAWSDRR